MDLTLMLHFLIDIIAIRTLPYLTTENYVHTAINTYLSNDDNFNSITIWALHKISTGDPQASYFTDWCSGLILRRAEHTNAWLSCGKLKFVQWKDLVTYSCHKLKMQCVWWSGANLQDEWETVHHTGSQTKTPSINFPSQMLPALSSFLTGSVKVAWFYEGEVMLD